MRKLRWKLICSSNFSLIHSNHIHNICRVSSIPSLNSGDLKVTTPSPPHDNLNLGKCCIAMLLLLSGELCGTVT